MRGAATDTTQWVRKQNACAAVLALQGLWSSACCLSESRSCPLFCSYRYDPSIPAGRMAITRHTDAVAAWSFLGPTGCRGVLTVGAADQRVTGACLLRSGAGASPWSEKRLPGVAVRIVSVMLVYSWCSR